MSLTPIELAGDVIERCLARGFALAGVCGVDPPAHASELLAWLDDGRHGDMDFMTEALEVRLNPSRLLDGARSFVMVADLYAARGEPEVVGPGSSNARIARYVRGDDYHRVMKRRLHDVCDALRAEHPGHRFRSFVDTAPVLEREMAERCGMGWSAKNTMLIHPELGSYFALGGFATTLTLEAPTAQERIEDHCGTCTRCIDACPTGAITPYHVDARRCISYLTIEHRDRIDDSLRTPIGSWVYGCDVCQEVCPHNAPTLRGVRRSEGLVSHAYATRHAGFDLLDVLGWDANARRSAFNSSAMKRATLSMMKRNALIAIGNLAAIPESGVRRSRYRRAIEDAMWNPNEPEMVRATAREVLASLDRSLNGAGDVLGASPAVESPE